MDHLDGILREVECQTQKKISLSQEALTDIQEISTFALLTLKEALKAFDFKDREIASNVLHKREVMKVKMQVVVQKHEQRVREQFCFVSASTGFLSLLNHLEGIRERAAEISCELLVDMND